MTMTDFSMVFLGVDSIDEIVRLQKIIEESLPFPEAFVLHDEEYLLRILRVKRSCIGVFNEGRLVAYSFISIPGVAEDGRDGNLGRDIGLLPQELGEVAHLQAQAVHPEHRGCGLQRALVLAHLRVIEEMGYRHVCSTVSPKNPVSLSNLLSCGLMIDGLALKARGWYRFILHRDLKEPEGLEEAGLEFGPGAAFQERTVPIEDLKGAAELLKMGFKGRRVIFSDRGAVVVYCKSGGAERMAGFEGLRPIN